MLLANRTWLVDAWAMLGELTRAWILPHCSHHMVSSRASHVRLTPACRSSILVQAVVDCTPWGSSEAHITYWRKRSDAMAPHQVRSDAGSQDTHYVHTRPAALCCLPAARLHGAWRYRRALRYRRAWRGRAGHFSAARLGLVAVAG